MGATMAQIDPYMPVCRVDGCTQLGQLTVRGGKPDRRVSPVCGHHAQKIKDRMTLEEKGSQAHASRQV